MDREKTIARLSGCYIAVATLFRDEDLELNLAGIRRHVRFLLEGGVREGNGVLLACGAAGEIAKFTGGEGHLDKLCLELVGLDSSRCRPPTRDIRPSFRDKARRMLELCGVPRTRS